MYVCLKPWIYQSPLILIGCQDDDDVDDDGSVVVADNDAGGEGVVLKQY